MKIKKPLVKRPESKDELKQLQDKTEIRILEITRKEAMLKSEYSRKTTGHNERIRALQEELRQEKSKLARDQSENRKERKQLADERIRLQYDLKSLKSRFSGFISGEREKVTRNPELAFRLMEGKKN